MRSHKVKRNPAAAVHNLAVDVRRALCAVAHKCNAAWDLFNRAARHSRNGKAVAIPGARYAPIVTLHKCGHTLQQFNPRRIVSVRGVLLQKPKQTAGRLSARHKLPRIVQRILDLELHGLKGPVQAGVFFL